MSPRERIITDQRADTLSLPGEMLRAPLSRVSIRSLTHSLDPLGCFKTHLTHDLRGLSDAELKGLDQWTSMYADSEKYFYVGKVHTRLFKFMYMSRSCFPRLTPSRPSQSRVRIAFLA